MRLASLASPLFLLAPALAGDVLEVGPARPFATIQSAVDVATPGDVVLVDPGIYAEDLDIDRGVAIVARGARPRIEGYVEIGPLPGSQAVVLSELAIAATETRFGPGGALPVVDVADCRGAVRLQDVEVRGVTAWTLTGDAGAALRCVRCANVVATDSLFVGATAGSTGFTLEDGGPAADVGFAAQLEVDRCDLVGGAGSTQENGGTGGAGARVRSNGRLLAYGSTIEGGPGGDAFGVLPGRGGTGLVVQGGGAARLQATSTLGGPGGSAAFGPPGPDGPARAVLGAVVDLAGTPRSLDAPALVRSSDPGWSVVTSGLESGETSALWLGFCSAPRDVPAFERPLRVLLGPTSASFDEVAADPNGEATLSFGPTVPPAGEDATIVWSQGLCRTQAGVVRLSASQATVFLGPGF